MSSDFVADDVEGRLIAYYDREGEQRSDRPLDPRRVAARARFIATLPAPPARVLEIGSGPGRDAPAFLHAGYSYAAIDLSSEHARRCRERGASVAVASARRLPFRSNSFDGLWTMSVLMHVPNAAIVGALAEAARVVKAGGVCAIGVWGGPDIEDETVDDRHPDHLPRFFSRRSVARWRSMLSSYLMVETLDVWGDPAEDFVYQLAITRKLQPHG